MKGWGVSSYTYGYIGDVVYKIFSDLQGIATFPVLSKMTSRLSSKLTSTFSSSSRAKPKIWPVPTCTWGQDFRYVVVEQREGLGILIWSAVSRQKKTKFLLTSTLLTKSRRSWPSHPSVILPQRPPIANLNGDDNDDDSCDKIVVSVMTMSPASVISLQQAIARKGRVL